ncbi:hypothetical protein SNEBB_010376 [Seison nebaliae]|nr:hypothetical protein SNEBB_010376 [Seison nebaliae]
MSSRTSSTCSSLSGHLTFAQLDQKESNDYNGDCTLDDIAITLVDEKHFGYEKKENKYQDKSITSSIDSSVSSNSVKIVSHMESEHSIELITKFDELTILDWGEAINFICEKVMPRCEWIRQTVLEICKEFGYLGGKELIHQLNRPLSVSAWYLNVDIDPNVIQSTTIKPLKKTKKGKNIKKTKEEKLKEMFEKIKNVVLEQYPSLKLAWTEANDEEPISGLAYAKTIEFLIKAQDQRINKKIKNYLSKKKKIKSHLLTMCQPKMRKNKSNSSSTSNTTIINDVIEDYYMKEYRSSFIQGYTIEELVLFLLSETSFSKKSSFHNSLLLSYYRFIERMNINSNDSTKNNVELTGKHWELVAGFQGNDPTTDLRGLGIVSLFYMLYMVSNDWDKLFVKQLFDLSKSSNQKFLLSATGINLTNSIHLLIYRHIEFYNVKKNSLIQTNNQGKESHKLIDYSSLYSTKTFSKSPKLISSTNNDVIECRTKYFCYLSTLFVATFYAFFDVWKREECTMEQCNEKISQVTLRLLDNHEEIEKNYIYYRNILNKKDVCQLPEVIITGSTPDAVSNVED